MEFWRISRVLDRVATAIIKGGKRKSTEKDENRKDWIGARMATNSRSEKGSMSLAQGHRVRPLVSSRTFCISHTIPLHSRRGSLDER